MRSEEQYDNQMMPSILEQPTHEGLMPLACFLPKLLENTRLMHLSGFKYLISSQQMDSYGNRIAIEHRFQAMNKEEAQKLFRNISETLIGVQQKIWIACCQLGNHLKTFNYECELTDLMKLTYPNKKGIFFVSERIEFYEHLKSLEQIHFVLSKSYKKTKSKKKETRISYQIPLLTIPMHWGHIRKCPHRITLSIRAMRECPLPSFRVLT